MNNVCSLCGARLESSACTNSLCRGFGKKVDSRSLKSSRSNTLTEQSQAVSPAEVRSANVRPEEPHDSPQGTTMARHIAGVLDNVLAWFLSVVCAKQLPDSYIVWQLVVMVVAYLGYFLVFESVFCTTPAKFMNGLVIRDFRGGRCSIRQTLIRTLFRLLEVNPALLGFLPAAASIIWSRHKQRFGDKVAGTVVVFR